MPLPQGANMGAFMQAMQGQGGGMPSGGMQPPSMPSPGSGAGAMPLQQPTQGQPAGMGGLPPQIQQLIQQLMQMGRGGDTLLAHLTPGEKTVPPEVQTPKVLATLDKAYKDKGVDPAQFTAGSPQSSKNPQTGLDEYNFMSAFLPAALGIGGALLAPETGGLSLGLSDAAAAGLLGGAGTTIGGLLTGKSPTQALASGALSGLGGYALSGLGGAAGDAASSAAGNGGSIAANASTAANSPAVEAALNSSLSSPTSIGLQATGKAISSNPSWTQMGGLLPHGFNPMQAIGSTVGGYVGDQLAAPQKPSQPVYPPGFNDPMHPLNTNYQQLLGKPPSSTAPNFTGYNPATNFPNSFNFYQPS